MTIDFPQRHLSALSDVATRLLDSRKPKTDLHPLARELYAGFCDVCARYGLDRALAELGDSDAMVAALVGKLDAIDLDGGGPRNAKPRQLVDCVIAGLGLALVDDPAPPISLGADVRAELAAAIARVVDGELAGTKLRDAVIAGARARCEEHYLGSFTKLTAKLDDHGLKLLGLPKVPIDALHAVQRMLSDARAAVVDRVGRVAIDRAKELLARADAATAARIDQPVTLRATPREVAIARAQAGATPADIARALLDGLSDVIPIAWRAAEQVVHPYAASKTFAVGDAIEHPKFGRGSVVASVARSIEVEFADGKRTLVHVPPRR
jgi:hypothetical protein